MRKKYIYLFGFVFVLAMLFLFGIQYSYYQKVLSINENQTRRLAQQALNEAVNDLELNEFVRVLNKDMHQNLSFHDRIESRELSNLLSEKMRRYLDSLPKFDPLDTLRFKEELIWSYFKQGENLDRYILKHLYGGYCYDSIPQLVPTQELSSKVRYYLDKKGIENKFILQLYDKTGQQVYEYIEPTMLRSSTDTLGGIRQGLFTNGDLNKSGNSFLSLKLDFKSSNRAVLLFALPGMIYISIIILLGTLFTLFLLKELSFQSMKANFINNMTHELKTPVSSISLAIQSLRNKQEDGKQNERKELLNVLEQEGNRLQLLVEKVLQSSLLRNKAHSMRFRTIDLYDILFPIVDIYTLHAEKLKGYLELEAEASDTWVSVDTIHMKNVFFNLFDNAIKYRRQDVPIEIKVSIKNTEENILISIEDNGIGVPKEALKKIFKRYYRVPTGNTHNVKGFGLGLAYVSDVIKIFNGSIVAQKSDQGGLRVLISLPLTEAEEE